MACDGLTITQMAKQLNDKSVVTPSVYLANVRGKYKTRAFWTYESVRNILINRIYTGDTEAFKSHVVKIGSNNVKQIPPNEREVIECTHEAIVSREEYFKANSVVKTKKKTERSTPTSKSVLNTYLACGHCGNKLMKGKVGSKNFICASHRYLSNSKCADVRANDEQIQKVVLNAINQQLALVDQIASGVRSEKRKDSSKKNRLINERNLLAKKVKEYDSKKLSLYEQFINKDIDKVEYTDQKEILFSQEQEDVTKISILEIEITELELGEDVYPSIQVDSSFNVDDLGLDIMKTFIDKIIVYSYDSINIVWNFQSNIYNK